jgi:hypothetical protein
LKAFYSSPRRWLVVTILLAMMLVIGITIGLP